MLMVIDNSISPCINEETIGFQHAKRRQFKVFVASMNDDNYMICIGFCLLDLVELFDRI